VEEKILDLQQKKRDLADAILRAFGQNEFTDPGT
jgi:hypothetical protein